MGRFYADPEGMAAAIRRHDLRAVEEGRRAGKVLKLARAKPDPDLLTPVLIDRLAQIVNNTKKHSVTRVKAAQKLLDIGHGRSDTAFAGESPVALQQDAGRAGGDRRGSRRQG